MPSLERFFPPIARFFDTNVKSLPFSRLYFYRANSTTLKATFKDKVGDIAHANPVEADASGKFPPIFLSGLYRVELRDKDNITQPGWPVDNVGQDSAIVPFAPWSEIVTYQTDDVATSPDGFWFRSLTDNNLGNDPDSSPTQWELVVIPIAANFTSSVPWATWSDSGTQLSLDIDEDGLSDGIGLRNKLTSSDDLHSLAALDASGRVALYYWDAGSQPANVPAAGAGYAERHWSASTIESLTVRMRDSNNEYVATKTTTWGDWDLRVRGDRLISSGDGLNGGGDLSADRTLSVDATVIRTTRQVNSGDGLDGGGDLSANRTLSVDSTVARVETARVELGGDFNAGSFVRCVKNGNVVTITSDGNIGHASSNSSASTVGAIPAAYRPSAAAENVYMFSSVPNGDIIRKATVTTDGTFRAIYVDWAGAEKSSASAQRPSITYVQDTT